MPSGAVAGPVTNDDEPPGRAEASQVMPTSPGRTTTVLLAATPPAIDSAATTAKAAPISVLELLTVRRPLTNLSVADHRGAAV
jgi:hypothetical protein